MKKTLGLLALLLLISIPASAQTVTFKLSFNQPIAAPETYASLANYQWTLKVDALAATVATVTCVAPVAPATFSVCTTPLPTLANGNHSLVVTAYNGFGSAASAPFAGGTPQSPTITSVTVTITP